ncbi:sensor of ECF-type sigma factor [Cognatitamlana onchidii]|uniref:sensor of ECF-type sigma factor n=1 Tax=Cognatitamlana onchidii TaxID=2562860 RepID=UPI0010A5F0B3|nr:sensor of ECF-type sigma factor [Algibacter onchidii]
MKQLIIIVLLLFSFSVNAQKKGHRERIKALKVAFITEQLNLSEKESQDFWPVYNDYEEKISSIRHHDIRDLRKEIRDNLETMSDEQASALVEEYNRAENKMHTTRLAFAKKLSDILPPKKIIKLKIAEEDFKKKMFEEFKKRKKDRTN